MVLEKIRVINQLKATVRKRVLLIRNNNRMKITKQQLIQVAIIIKIKVEHKNHFYLK